MEDFTFDNFINYSDSPSLFASENFPDLDFQLSSPFTEISGNSFPTQSTPPFQVNKSSPGSEAAHYFSGPDSDYNKHKPFKISKKLVSSIFS